MMNLHSRIGYYWSGRKTEIKMTSAPVLTSYQFGIIAQNKNIRANKMKFPENR